MPTSARNPDRRQLSTSSHWVGSNPPTVTVVDGYYDSYSRGWQNHPEYWKKKADKEFLTTRGFTYRKDIRGILNGTSVVRNTTTGLDIEGTTGVCTGTYTVPGWMPVLTSCRDNGLRDYIYSQMEADLLPKIKDQKVNLAAAFGEARQTADLLAGAATSIYKSFKALRSGNLPGAVRALTGSTAVPNNVNRAFRREVNSSARQRAANTWLQLQYGWKPLLSDVYGSAEQCAKSLNRPRLTKVSTSKQYSSSTSFTYQVGLNSLLTAKEVYSDKFRGKMTCVFSVDSAAARTMTEIGVTNPALVAWELLPYSFVVDWFLPIGSWLGNIDATANCNLVNRTNSFKYEHRCDFIVTGGADSSYTYDTSMIASPEILELERERSIFWPSNNFPEFKNPLSLSHVANSLALLQQVFR